MRSEQAARPARSGTVDIHVMGELAVYRDGQPLPLPQSKKTRCLLAYLAVVQRPQRRERLCEMFWEVPDDPRGALRWSLSKARQVIGDALEASRESVHLNTDRIGLDYREAMRALSGDLSSLDTEELERLAALFRGPFLADLALPRCAEYEAWRVSHVNELELLQLRLRRLLIDRLRSEPQRALVHAHALLALNPEDKAVAAEAESLALESRRQTLGQTPAPIGLPRQATVRTVARKLPSIHQDIRYCTTRSGVRIAYAECGEGMPIVKTANWMSHLEFEWESPIWRHWIEALSEQNRLIRYDERGNGLSDRRIDDVSFEALLADLEDVIDAASVDRFALLGVSHGCAISIAYAVRHPERVSHLVVYGGFARGWRAAENTEKTEYWTTLKTLIRQGWGQNNPAFRQVFTSLFIPGANQQQMDWFNELQRKTVSPEIAERLHDSFGNFDVVDLLPKVAVPTLVLHAHGDAVVPFKSGRAIATRIPSARFVTLESDNHILLADEPAFGRFVDELRRFIASNPGS